MTIKEAQEAVDTWIKTYGVRYFSELTNMAFIARTYGDQSFKPGEKPNLGEEMADVLWVLICLANQTGTDLTEELQKSIDKKTSRDKDRHLNNPKLTGVATPPHDDRRTTGIQPSADGETDKTDH